MKKSIFVIGANGVVGSILCKKLTDFGFNVQVGRRPAPGESVFGENFKNPDLVVNLAYELGEADSIFLENLDCPVLDTTSKYRTNSDWVYGLANLPEQTQRIALANRVSNPGCFSQGGVLLLYPLVQEAIIDLNCFVSLQAVGGYSSAGKPAYNLVEQNNFHSHIHSLTKPHPHKAEIQKHSNFRGVLDFTPISAEFERGTFVKFAIPEGVALTSELQYVYNKYYSHSDISIKEFPSKLALDAYKGVEGASLYIGAVQDDVCVNIAIHFDNLLKGAASTAFKNICIMLKEREV